MTDTSGLWKTGFSLLAAGVVLDTVRQTQKEYLQIKNPKKNLPTSQKGKNERRFI